MSTLQHPHPQLLTLPTELRDRIYFFLLADNHFHITHRGAGTELHLAAFPGHHPHPASTVRVKGVLRSWESVFQTGRLVEVGCASCSPSDTPSKNLESQSPSDPMHVSAYTYRPMLTTCRQIYNELLPCFQRYLSQAMFSFSTNKNTYTYTLSLPKLWQSSVTRLWLVDTTQGESVLNHLLKNNRMLNLREAHISLHRQGVLRPNASKGHLLDSVVRPELAIMTANVERLAKRFEAVNVSLIVHDDDANVLSWSEWVAEQNAYMAARLQSRMLMWAASRVQPSRVPQ